MIYIVGLGPGHEDYILPKAIKTLENCDIVVGFKRALDSLDIDDLKKYYMKTLTDVDKFISKENNGDEYINKNIAIVASGDPTFYGITNYIKSKAQVTFEIIPGISSFQYLTSRVQIPWNNAYLGSLHGRSEDFINKVKEHDVSIWLTDKENNPNFLCEILDKEKIKCRVIVGENLSYDDEKISEGNPINLINNNFGKLSVFIVDTTFNY